jgi:hypothetical protein
MRLILRFCKRLDGIGQMCLYCFPQPREGTVMHQLMTFLGDLILPIWLTILLIDIARILI